MPAGQCATVPAGSTSSTMGGVPEAFVTAHDAMCTQAGAIAGEWVLIHAVGSGVGTAALQLAKAIGARVVGTSRSARQARAVRGARARPRHRAADARRRLARRRGADRRRSPTSPAAASTSCSISSRVPTSRPTIAAAAPGGRIVLIGTLAGGSATLQILTVMQRRLRIFGTVLRTRSTAEKAAATDAFARDVVPFLADRHDRTGDRGDACPSPTPPPRTTCSRPTPPSARSSCGPSDAACMSLAYDRRTVSGRFHGSARRYRRRHRRGRPITTRYAATAASRPCIPPTCSPACSARRSSARASIPRSSARSSAGA